jgi:hypothetical protein
MTKSTGRPGSGRSSDTATTASADSEPDNPVEEKAVVSLLENVPALNTRRDLDVRHFVAASVSSALVTRQVPGNQLCLPSMEVFLPAMEAIGYSPMKEAFAALIARAMDRRVAHTVLPAYVDMLKQLSADELLLLGQSPKLGRFTPVADVVYSMPGGQVLSAYRSVLPPSSVKGLTHKDNIPLYVDNLERLNLLFRPQGQVAADNAYRPLERIAFVRELMKAAPPRSRPGIDRYVIGLTDLGASFLKACLV